MEKPLIDKKVSEAKQKKIEQMMDEHGYIFCEVCGVNSLVRPIDCSHDVSVDRCQKEGMTELAWDTENITMRCRKCHQEYDGLGIKSGKNE